MRRRVVAALTVAVVVLMPLVARADLLDGSGHDPEIAEQTGLAFVGERSAQQLEASGVISAEPGDGSGGAALTGPSGGDAFSFFGDREMPCSLTIEGPAGCGQAVEPEVKSAPDGTIFVTSMEGTPAGVMAWRRDPGSYAYKQLTKPDTLSPSGAPETGVTGGGGDNELAIGTPDPSLGGAYRVYTSSLNSLVTNGVEVSTNRGDTWFSNPIASMWAAVDRQWLAATGPKTVYLAYHELQARSILLTRSDDGGITWGVPQEMFTLDTLKDAFRVGVQGRGAGNGNVESNLVALPGGGVALSYTRAPAGTPTDITTVDSNDPTQPSPGPALSDVWVASIDAAGVVHNNRVGSVLPTAVGLFPAIAVDSAGGLYVTASNLHGVFLATSGDGGQTWSAFSNVTASAPADNATTVFPYVVAGSPGRVALAWLGTPSSTGTTDADANWTVQFAYSDDALAAVPTFTVTQASDHIVHHGVICLSGTSCDPLGNSRALAEVLQMGITNDGRALISYPDTSDGRYSAGWAWVVEQNGGPGLLAGVTPTPPPPPPPAGHRVPTFTGTGTAPLYFTNGGSGIGVGDGVLADPGYRFDGVTPGGALSSAPGTVGHAGIIGYAANSTPGVSAPVVFAGAPVATATTMGGTLHIELWVQNELGANGSTELDFSLLDVDPTGASQAIVGRAVKEGVTVVGGNTPTLVTADIPIEGGWFLPAGDHLVMSMSFPYLVSSTTRFYYGDAVYPSGIAITTS